MRKRTRGQKKNRKYSKANISLTIINVKGLNTQMEGKILSDKIKRDQKC